MLSAPLLTAAVDAFKIPDLRRKLIFTLAITPSRQSRHLLKIKNRQGPLLKLLKLLIHF